MRIALDVSAYALISKESCKKAKQEKKRETRQITTAFKPISLRWNRKFECGRCKECRNSVKQNFHLKRIWYSIQLIDVTADRMHGPLIRANQTRTHLHAMLCNENSKNQIKCPYSKQLTLKKKNGSIFSLLIWLRCCHFLICLN